MKLPGDLVVLYTDGITEAMSPSEEFFGDVRVSELVAHSDRDGEALLQHLIAQVQVFEGGTQPFDDGAANDASPGAHHGTLIGQAKVVEATLPSAATLAPWSRLFSCRAAGSR